MVLMVHDDEHHSCLSKVGAASVLSDALHAMEMSGSERVYKKQDVVLIFQRRQSTLPLKNVNNFYTKIF